MKRVEVGKAKCFVICAPSGAGKTTLMNKIIEGSRNIFYDSVSDTTRKMRSGEVDGKDYNFISVPEFKSRLKNGEYLENAEVHGNYYGTRKAPLFDAMDAGKSPFLVIDVQGFSQLQKNIPEDKLCAIFILPPNEEEIINRINKRDDMSEEDLKIRLKNSKKECAVAPEFRYCVTNDDLETTYSIMKFIIGKEMELKRY